MRTHGRLFQDEMVVAYLEGRKTQTRRPATVDQFGDLKLLGGFWTRSQDGIEGVAPSRLPYAVGDDLWIREAARLSSASGTGGVTDTVRLCYRARNDLLSPTHHRQDWSPYAADRWTPSVSMPRWAARLVLPIVSVRVERVQDITEQDAQAEGVGQGYVPCPHTEFSDLQTTRCVGHRPMFLRLWRELYGAKYPPETAWCWVIETKPFKGATR